MNDYAKQLNLPFVDECRTHEVTSKLQYDYIHRNKATFKNGLDEKVHRWFRLTPSFGPHLVRHILSATSADEKAVVYDPFAGAATTLIECQLLGLGSVGTEINPFLHWAGKTSLMWDIDIQNLQESLKPIILAYNSLRKKYASLSPEEIPFEMPRIYNVYRWWRPDILKDIILLKHAIQNLNRDNQIKQFYQLVLASVLVPDLTNITLGRLQLHFIDRSDDQIDVLKTWMAKAEQMVSDLSEVIELSKPSQRAILLLQDATNIVEDDFPSKATHVITSPPYPNRYSYVWNTRPHLYMLDFFSEKSEASGLDKLTIGGTWGAATSSLAKGVIGPLYPAVEEHIIPIAQCIRTHDNLMANYLMKYFNLLAKQIMCMRNILDNHAKIAYVVGCSRLKGVYVETDLLLGKIFESLSPSFKVSEISRIRRRNSGKNLYESIVYVTYDR